MQLSEYSTKIIAASVIIGFAAAKCAERLERLAKNSLAEARKNKESGFSKYPNNSREFGSLKEKISGYLENKEVASKINKLLEALFHHSFAKPEFKESDGQLSVNMVASKQYKLINGGKEQVLYIPKVVKFHIDQTGKIAFGKMKKGGVNCDRFVPYIIGIPSNLFKFNSYWSEVLVDSRGGLKVTGPNNFGFIAEQGGGTPMTTHYNISDIS